MERGRAGRGGARRGFERGHDAEFSWRGFAVSRAAIPGSWRVRNAGVRGAGRRGRRRVVVAAEVDRLCAAEADGVAALDALLAASRGGIVDRTYRHSLPTGDGRGLRDRGPSDARRVYVENTAD